MNLIQRLTQRACTALAGGREIAQPDPEPPQAESPSKALAENFRILAHQQGLAASRKSGRPVAADGSPIPWYTYPAVEYFRQLDVQGFTIFEFGCGNSSLFWARKQAKVWSVEHDPHWYEIFAAQASQLQGLALRQDKHAYSAAVMEPEVLFDIIIIDGAWRNECLQHALNCLHPGSIIILDNSDWYLDVALTLRKVGFFQVDFNGFGSCNTYCWTTSLFLPWASPLIERIGPPQPIGGIPVRKGKNW